jgi:transcription elongation factor Elf1
VFGLVENTGVIFGKTDHLGTGRVSLKVSAWETIFIFFFRAPQYQQDIMERRKFNITLPLVSHRGSHQSMTHNRVALSAKCQVCNMRFASTVLFPSELAQVDKFSDGSDSNNNNNNNSASSEAERKAAHAEKEQEQRARLISMGSMAAAKAPEPRHPRATSGMGRVVYFSCCLSYWYHRSPHHPTFSSSTCSSP